MKPLNILETDYLNNCFRNPNAYTAFNNLVFVLKNISFT